MLDIAYDIEQLIEGISSETVVENLNNALMNSADKKLPSLGEPEFVWTALCQAMTQKSVREADTIWTNQKCFSCVTVRCGDVECAKQDAVSLSTIQSESYTWNTGGARTIHTNYLDRHRVERCSTKMGIMIVEAWAGEQLPVVSGTGETMEETCSRVSVGRWVLCCSSKLE